MISFYCYTVFIYVYCLLSTAVDAQLDDVGLDFVKNSISAIEKRGKFKIFNVYNQKTFFFF